MATHQMYGQTGGAAEPQIDQNMHNRNYYSTRYLYYFLLFFARTRTHTHAPLKLKIYLMKIYIFEDKQLVNSSSNRHQFLLGKN